MSTQSDSQVLERNDVEFDEPNMYNVILLNDDYTPFDFVVYVLIEVFDKSSEEAIEVTNNVHHKGRGVAGTYVKDIAETKSLITNKTAKSNGFPLETLVEEA